jgi:hypothetical protein
MDTWKRSGIAGAVVTALWLASAVHSGAESTRGT